MKVKLTSDCKVKGVLILILYAFDETSMLAFQPQVDFAYCLLYDGIVFT